MPAKKSLTEPKPKPAERATRRASSAPKHKSVSKTPKRTRKAVAAEVTPTGETSSFVTTTTSPEHSAHKRSRMSSDDDKKATPVPIKLIKDLQAVLQKNVEDGKAPKSRSYSQDELKHILNNFWEVLKHELLYSEGHKVSLMNYMTFRLVFRDGQKFTPPKNGNSLKSPEEVTKPPRWNLSVNIKDKLKQELQQEFAHAHKDIVDAFHSGRSAKGLAVQKGLLKMPKHM